jgi:hypothetical protein
MREVPLQFQYFPDGFPSVGLQAKTLPLNYRSTVNLERLGKKLQRWEADHGNDGFIPKNLHRTNPELAYELSNVYIALRERFPSVRPEYVSFSSHIGDQVLAYAWQYASTFPHLRSYGIDPYDTQALEELANELDSATMRAVRRDVQFANGVNDPYLAGAIDIGSTFSSERRYRALLKFWRDRNVTMEQKGMPLRVPALATSAAAFTLVHEFGHLLDAELILHDPEASEHLYATLSYCVTGEWPHSTRQWKNHLINYPAAQAELGGPCPGTPESRRYVRQQLRRPIMDLLTRYAVVSRDELFAEAFALTFCAADPVRVARLEPFRVALRDVGVLRNRPAS